MKNNNCNEKILLVDDRHENLVALETTLKEFDVPLIRAYSGNEALEKTLEHDFALALIDVQMPEMDGYETVKIMRSSKHTKMLPVIFISAIYTEEHYIEQGIESGAVDFIQKPVNPDLLKGKVRVFINLFRQRKILEEEIQNRKKTEKKLEQTQKELILAKEKAEDADKMKSEFLANMSHEIRTPLNAIIGFSELFAKEELTSDTKEIYRRYINRSSGLLLNLINDIIDLAKIEAGKINIEPAEENLLEIFNELEISAQTNIQQRLKTGLELIKKIPDNTGNIVLFIDVNRFKQIFNNLLTNAIKYTLKGHVEFGIGQLKKESITFYVKDTGIGIPEDKLQVIFERFGQIRNAKNFHIESTGLGLFISKKLVEFMGGKIWAESVVNQGSTFYFQIPRTTIKQKQQTAEQTKTVAKSNKLIWEQKELLILIVEDEPINYMLLNEILIKKGIKTLWAKNGMQAIQTLKENHQFDLILMDLKMPVLNGYDAFDKIKKMNNTVPIIAQTAYAMSEDKKKALARGFNDYLAKPIKADLLLEKINNLLSQ